MFGGGFGQSTFGQQQPQQQQQQQQQPAFGATPNAFGAAAPSAFGQSTFGQPAQPAFGGGGFGQPAQQQQPSAFGQPAAAAPTFGQPAGQSSLFGAPAAPAASPFSFGGASSSPFGAPAASAAPTTSLFGAPKPATPSFGSFGAPAQPQQPSSIFGAPQQQPGQQTQGAFGQPAQSQPTGTGTAIVPYAVTKVMEPATEPGKPIPANQAEQQYQSISSMDQYKNYSVEELRMQDYQANQKVPSAAPATSAFGGGFGATPTSAPAFGASAPATNLFGQQQSTGAFGSAAPTTSLFGSTAPKPSLFGSAPTTGAFGQPAAQSAFGAASTAAPTSGLFGQTSAPSAFGQPAASAAPTFGGFGGAAAAPKPSFSFGAPATTSAPAFGASATPATSNPFGQPATTATTSLFGQPQQQQGQQPGAQASNPFSFGGTSAAPAAKPSLFGAPAAGGGGLFGQPAGDANKPTFSFGATSQPAATPGFGQQAQQQPAFGQAPAGGSTFGSSFGQQAAAPAAGGFGGGSLFGAKPAFGQSQPAATSLFGQPQQQQQQQQPLGGSTGLFGGGSSLFGGAQQQQQQQQPQQQQQQQQQQQAYATADDANAYGSNPLFSSTVGASPVSTQVQKKQPPIFTAFRGTPVNRSSTKITRLRGFGNSVNSPASPLSLSTFGGSSSLQGSTSGYGPATPGSPRGSPLRLVNGIGDDAALSPSAFVSRPSVKKLVIDRRALGDSSYLTKSATSALASSSLNSPPKAGGSGQAAGKGKVTFNSEVEIPSRQFRHQDESIVSQDGDGTPVKKSTAANGNNLAEEGASASTSSSSRVLGGDSDWSGRRSAKSSPAKQPELQQGDYYSKPSIEELQKLPATALQAVPDLIIGCIGFGEVFFHEPVDLTGLPSLDSLFEIAAFSDRNFTLDGKGEGRGLNVPATITLERCWPVDKATRKPIKDPQHPRLQQHIKRLQNLPDTKFIDFNAEEGKWVFSVEGFA